MATTKPRPSLRKRPAASPASRRNRSALVTPEPLGAGQLVFWEDALVAAQALRRAEDFVAQQPLFCATCCGPCGSLLVDLSLANHTIHRAELLNVVRTSARDGDDQRLQRWLDFATKCAGLPQLPGAEVPGLHVMDVPDTSPQADLCFCSLDCRNAFPPEMCMEKSPLLSAANKLIATAALLPGDNGLRSKDEFMTLLQPLLQCVRGRSRLSFSQSMLEGCHRRLIGVLAERIPGTKAMARKAARALVAPELYSRIVASLDTRSWSLSGETMPSRLGQYCESAFAVGGALAPALQSEAAQVLGPVVDDLLQLQEELSESSAEEVELVVPLPQTNEAKKSSVVFWPKLLSDEEIDEILQFSAKIRGDSEAQWSTCYLQSGGAHGSLQPILSKLKDLALHVDARPGGWKRLHGDLHTRLQSRCVEHHSVTTGGALPDPTHFDGGSLFTIDVMLNTPGVDFQGGEFCTMESDENLHPHHFGKGDALVFLSHKAHCVQPVTHGLRQTLVMELWEGEERCCNHRCQQRWGPCRGSAGAAGTAPSLQRLREEGPNLFAATAFDGVAFFPSLGRLLRQSAKRPKAEANVEVLFEEVKPKAFVRATRKIRRGEMLVLK